MKSRRKLATISTTVIGALAGTIGFTASAVAAENCASPSANPSAAVLVLLDRSGSMADPGKCKTSTSTSTRKWECAVPEAKSYITGGPGAPNFADETAFFVWQFRLLDSDPDPTKITFEKNGTALTKNGKSYYSGYCRTDAANFLTIDQVNNPDFYGPTVHDANTPLAAAYCKAVKFLTAYRDALALDFPLYIKIESDGVDNLPTLVDPNFCAGQAGGTANFSVGTDSSGNLKVAFGPMGANPAVTADGLVIGDWEANMYDAAITGTRHNPPINPSAPNGAFQYNQTISGPTAVITNFSFIEDFITTTASLQVASPLALAAPLAGNSVTASLGVFAALAQTTATPSDNDLLANYFNGLARTGGGRMVRYGSGAAVVGGTIGSYHVLPGDANDNGCVNGDDNNLVTAAYGQRATAGNANAIRADLNEDGIVNATDYLVIKNQWGKGCSTSPGTVPVSPNAVFGFEDASSWSSPQAALSYTGVKHTEGIVSLKIGGSGYREIKSIAFGSQLQPAKVTSTLAMDVLRPITTPNPPSYATIQIFASAPSAGLNSVPLGNAVDIRTNTANAFTTVNFAIPTNVKNAMIAKRSDLTLKVVLNALDAGYELDNLRFK